MITLLGKRPFVGRSDEMDKWLDDNQSAPSQSGEKSAPPPIEEAPLPMAMRRDETEL